MAKGTVYDNLNAAQRMYGLSGSVQDGMEANFYNTTKMKFSFVVHFELTEAAKELIRYMYGTDVPLDQYCSFVIKDVALPSYSFDTDEINQYNRTRLASGKIRYAPINMALYDTVNSSCFNLLHVYRRFYYGDFSQKSFASWNYDNVSTPDRFEFNDNVINENNPHKDRPNDYNWGRSVFNQGDQNEGYFFKRIDIYEVDGTVYTVHNIHNPVIENVEMATKSHENDDPALINLTFRYEGVSNVCPITKRYAISQPTAQIAKKLAEPDEEFSASMFFRYWGALDTDKADRSKKNALYTAGFPDTAGSDTSLTGSFGTLTGMASTAIGAASAISGVIEGGFDGAGDTLANLAGAIGEGTTESSITGDAGNAASAVSSIGGLL